MRVPGANSENRTFDDTKGQKFVHLNLNLSSVKALVVIFYYKTESVEFKKKRHRLPPPPPRVLFV